jgi:hypothetical protein
VAQHDDLKLPLTATADKHTNENAQEPVEQRHQHEAQSEPAPPRSPVDPRLRPTRLSLPHTPATAGVCDLQDPTPVSSDVTV